MAYLTKEQYDRRRENAAVRSINNERTAIEHGATKEQAEAISKLCALRHELHTTIDHLVNDSSDMCNRLDNFNGELGSCGLATLVSEWEEFDDMNILHECGQFSEETYDDDYCRIAEGWELLNKHIENYLRDIDSHWGTTFCPTGALRIM